MAPSRRSRGGGKGKFALFGSAHHFSNILEIPEMHTSKSRKAELPDSMPCMTNDSSAKVRPWEFGSSPF